MSDDISEAVIVISMNSSVQFDEKLTPKKLFYKLQVHRRKNEEDLISIVLNNVTLLSPEVVTSLFN